MMYVKDQKLVMNHDELLFLLKSEEYKDYIMYKDNWKGEERCWIDTDAMPETHYRPVNGDYCFGFTLIGLINELLGKGITDIPIVASEVRKEGE